jgi:hypothetical protein
MSLNFPFLRAVSQKNTDGTHSVVVTHTHGVVSEITFSLVAHSEAMAKAIESFLNAQVAAVATEVKKVMVAGPNKPLEVRTDGDTVIKLKKDMVPEKNIGKQPEIDVTAKVGKQEPINTSAKSIFPEESKAAAATPAPAVEAAPVAQPEAAAPVTEVTTE